VDDAGDGVVKVAGGGDGMSPATGGTSTMTLMSKVCRLCERAVAGIDGDRTSGRRGLRMILLGSATTTPVAELMVKPPPGVADQAVGHGRPVDVGRGGRHAGARAAGAPFATWSRRRCPRASWRNVADADGEGLRTSSAPWSPAP
jgi:hypothetical protein